MIRERKTKASTASEVINSFLLISHDKDFVTEEDLRSSLPSNQVEYCLSHMKKTDQGYDFKEFVNSVYLYSLLSALSLPLSFFLKKNSERRKKRRRGGKEKERREEKNPKRPLTTKMQTVL